MHTRLHVLHTRPYIYGWAQREGSEKTLRGRGRVGEAAVKGEEGLGEGQDGGRQVLVGREKTLSPSLPPFLPLSLSLSLSLALSLSLSLSLVWFLEAVSRRAYACSSYPYMYTSMCMDASCSSYPYMYTCMCMDASCSSCQYIC